MGGRWQLTEMYFIPLKEQLLACEFDLPASNLRVFIFRENYLQVNTCTAVLKRSRFYVFKLKTF